MKYIIDIDTDKVFTDGQNNKLYKATNFNALVFDKCGLDKLEDYAKAMTEHYNQGFADGQNDATYNTELIEELKQTEYNKGIDGLIDAMRLYYRLNSEERVAHFGRNIPVDRYAITDPKDLILSAKAYEEKEKAGEIKVGDEIENVISNTSGYVIGETPECCVGIYYDDSIEPPIARFAWNKNDCKKTGRHIDMMSQILDELKGSKNE